ncbi:hypothetical protein ACFQZC_04150 [Streptacidiphilus monticola]
MAASSRAVVAGANPAARTPSFAAGVSTTSGRRRRAARTTVRAARSASVDSSGIEAAAANQAYSASCRPWNRAAPCEPVRISPGSTVVTLTPSRASSARSPSDRPVPANLAAT